MGTLLLLYCQGVGKVRHVGMLHRSCNRELIYKAGRIDVRIPMDGENVYIVNCCR